MKKEACFCFLRSHVACTRHTTKVCPIPFVVLRGHATRSTLEENRIESVFAKCRRESFPYSHRHCAGLEKRTERAPGGDPHPQIAAQQRGADRTSRSGRCAAQIRFSCRSAGR